MGDLRVESPALVWDVRRTLELGPTVAALLMLKLRRDRSGRMARRLAAEYAVGRDLFVAARAQIAVFHRRSVRLRALPRLKHEYKGGVRNHDVLAVGRADCGQVVLGVEGKVNESLDKTINQKYAAASARRAAGKNTNLDKRLDGLLHAIAGHQLEDKPQLGRLRYQLFSAVAGTLAAATEETAAVALVIHLIASPRANPAKFDEARRAVADWVGTVLGQRPGAPVTGPFSPSTTPRAYELTCRCGSEFLRRTQSRASPQVLLDLFSVASVRRRAAEGVKCARSRA